MEALVQSIFRDFYNCDVEYYSSDTYAADGGIDLVAILSEGGLRAAIQVKRRAKDIAESVICIREFVGAMVMEGFQKGLYVTTGRFSKPAREMSVRLGELACGRQLSLELVGSAHLYDLLVATAGCPFDDEFWNQAIEQYQETPFFVAGTDDKAK